MNKGEPSSSCCCARGRRRRRRRCRWSSEKTLLRAFVLLVTLLLVWVVTISTVGLVAGASFTRISLSTRRSESASSVIPSTVVLWQRAKEEGGDNNSRSNSNSKREEAERYLEKARALRQQVSFNTSTANKKDATNATATTSSTKSPWNVDPPTAPPGAADYRLYVDIGREDGTWMDPRWGASGRRMELSLDVRFGSSLERASPEIASRMVQDNFGGRSSPTYSR